MAKETDGNKIFSYMTTASSNLRSVGRTVVYAIIATSWAISYTQEGFHPIGYIRDVLILSIIYVFLDLLYYLISAILYKYYLTKYFIPDKDGDFQYKDPQTEITKGTKIWMEIGQVWVIILSLILLAAAVLMILTILSMDLNS